MICLACWLSQLWCSHTSDRWNFNSSTSVAFSEGGIHAQLLFHQHFDRLFHFGLHEVTEAKEALELHLPPDRRQKQKFPEFEDLKNKPTIICPFWPPVVPSFRRWDWGPGAKTSGPVIANRFGGTKTEL